MHLTVLRTRVSSELRDAMKKKKSRQGRTETIIPGTVFTPTTRPFRRLISLVDVKGPD